MVALSSSNQCPQTFFNSKHIGSVDETLSLLVTWDAESIYTGHSAAERYIEIENECDPEDESLRAPPAKDDVNDDEGAELEDGAVFSLFNALSDVKEIQYNATEGKDDDKDEIDENQGTRNVLEEDNNDATSVASNYEADDDHDDMLAGSQGSQKSAAGAMHMPIVFLLAFRHLFHGFLKQTFRRNKASSESNDVVTDTSTGTGEIGTEWDLDNVEIPDIPDIENESEDVNQGSSDTIDFSSAAAESASAQRTAPAEEAKPSASPTVSTKSNSKGKCRAILRRLPFRRTKNRGLQLLKSRSGSSDESDPATSTQAMSNSTGSGDSGDKVSTDAAAASHGYSGEAAMHSFLAGLPANPDPYVNGLNGDCDGSASDAFSMSYHDDDDTLDNISYTFSDDIGAVESRDVDSVADLTKEIRLKVSNDEDIEDDDVSLLDGLLGDDDEGGVGGLPSDEDDGNNDTSSNQNNTDHIHVNNPAIDDEDEYEDIRPIFKHHTLRHASETHTSYDFAVNEERDDIGCAQTMPLNKEVGYDLVDL